MTSFIEFLQQTQQRVNAVLENYLPPVTQNPSVLHQAMRYAVLNNGKRIRPALIFATSELIDLPNDVANIIAAAVEMIHSYSLVHDDLPAIDNDDLRRGRPTVHKAFDEATAILVGDALQNLAFEILAGFSSTKLTAARQLNLLHTLATACNSAGMVGGQALDIAATTQQISLNELAEIHSRKTGALIHACVKMCLCAVEKLAQHEIMALEQFAREIGLAFQIRDDILDEESSTAILGKTQGADRALGKATYPAILGMDKAKEKLAQVYTHALECLSQFGDNAARLRQFAEYVVTRDH